MYSSPEGNRLLPAQPQLLAPAALLQGSVQPFISNPIARARGEGLTRYLLRVNTASLAPHF